MSKERLARLVAIAAMKRDADLSRLAAAAARLSRAEALRAEIEAGLRRETVAVTTSHDLAGLTVLEGHERFLQQTLDRLAGEIGRLAAQKEDARTLAATSFGRALAIESIAASPNAAPGTGGQ